MSADDREAQTVQPSPRSDPFQKPSKFITGMVSQSVFDKSCMILAEVIGTGMLMFFGCMGTVHWDGPPGIVAPINFGFTVMMIIQVFGHVSYALLNPAVSICAVVNNLISVKMAILMSLAQLVGATLGYGLLLLMTPEEIFFQKGLAGTCMTLPHPAVSVTKAFFIEFLLTSALVATVCGVWDPRNRAVGDSAAIRIGLTIVALSLAGGPFTDASMNPVRSFGPALWNGNWDYHWLYWVAPLAAGLVSSSFYKMIFWRKNPKDQPEGQPLTPIQKTDL